MHASLDLGEWTSLTGKSFYVWKRIVQPVASTGSSENAGGEICGTMRQHL